MKTDTEINLKSRWNLLREGHPKLRIRDAARDLGVSEAELLATGCGDTVQRLVGPWDVFLRELPSLGHVMCLTRNEAAVHERHGVFHTPDFFHGMGQVASADIDLRFFMSHWHLGFAVTERTGDGVRSSVQFFDQDGSAVHKIYLQIDSDHDRFQSLVVAYLHSDQSTDQAVNSLPAAKPDRPDAEVDVASFRDSWRGMQDTHEFFMLTAKYGLGRLQALRLAEPEMAVQLSVNAGRQAIEVIAERQLPMMIFVGNAGCIQIHTGQVTNLKTFGPWFNILDEEFNLHLREDLVAHVWLVRKPTRDGIVTSIELYDEAGQNIALLFGKRKPGQPEDPQWREVVDLVKEGK